MLSPAGFVRLSVVLILLCLSVVAVLARQSAWAAFPGANGKIAFVGGGGTNQLGQIYVVNLDGTALSQLTSAGENWSSAI
jgi:hypothetical protein